FFFQAEDGIRDFHVTGVQTCALPIFVLGNRLVPRTLVQCLRASEVRRAQCLLQRMPRADEPGVVQALPRRVQIVDRGAAIPRGEIGRASCRERVESWVGAVWSKKEGE